jgi:sulfite reductase (NADPH) flavoprotein alpha-component
MSETVVASPYSRTNPFKAKITENRPLSKTGSEKDTRHFIVSLEGSGLAYNPGDSLGVLPKNAPGLVDETLAAFGLTGAETLPGSAPGTTTTVREVFSTALTLNRAGRKFVKALVEKLPPGPAKDGLAALIADEAKLDEYVFTRDYVDILKEFPGLTFTAEEAVGLMVKLQPRLYSIASSHKAHPGEVHLTIAVVNYTTHGRKKYGVATGYLAEVAKVNEPEVGVYVQPTKHFHLPPPDKDIIMCGPGTGIAPFRAFLEERAVTGATGKNWLFFGEQRKAYDFYYEEEFASYQAKGVLTKLDVAFSRDSDKKVYVQDRIRENGAEVWKWFQSGAYFYICGDAKRMAKDVENTLIEVAKIHGGLSDEAAKEYITVTFAKTEKRYLKDVY